MSKLGGLDMLVLAHSLVAPGGTNGLSMEQPIKEAFSF